MLWTHNLSITKIIIKEIFVKICWQLKTQTCMRCTCLLKNCSLFPAFDQFRVLVLWKTNWHWFFYASVLLWKINFVITSCALKKRLCCVCVLLVKTKGIASNSLNGNTTSPLPDDLVHICGPITEDAVVGVLKQRSVAGENYVSMFIASNVSNCLTQLNPIKMIMCWIPNNLQVHFSTRLDYGFKLTTPTKNFSEKLIGFWVKNWSVLWLKIFVKDKLSPVKLQPLRNQELLKALVWQPKAYF